MRYHNITKDDMLNGDGLRVVVWVSGCEHQCPGCQNPCTWNPESGLLFTENEEMEIWEQLDQDYIEGVTFSGGDPLHPANRDEIGKLARKIKEKYPDKTIWLYTGYKFRKVNDEFIFFNERTLNSFSIDWFDCIDVIIDGRFSQEQRKIDIDNHRESCWKGSSNQRTIDVKQSLTENKIVYHKYDKQIKNGGTINDKQTCCCN